MQLKTSYLIVFSTFFVFSSGALLGGFKTEETRFCIEEPEGPLLYKFAYDMIYLNASLLSIDSLKLGLVFTPWYIAARSADEQVHSCFYCSDTHKNCCQMSKECHSAADKGAIVIASGLASMAILPWFDEDLRVTARVYAAGLVPLWGLKNAFKRVQHNGCLRPKCEYFSKDKKYYGGCPSGHTAFISYATTLFGLQLGWEWGVPLGIASTAIFTSSINSNRHYVSQIVAGAGLGIVYGIAANKVLNGYLHKDINCDVYTECNGASGLQFSWSY